ncbi:MAG: ABC transporter ATP-binding protein, partial [Alphaproteobacteria bacterium]|nr:ABC transporter ATP-binding protein [Alphaproteobacteria bacterium]
MKNNIDLSTEQQSPSSSTNSLTQATAQPLIHVNNVHKSYPMGTTTVQALCGVNLQIQKGEFTALIGTSGSGKSTLLNLIGCLDDADSGQVLIDGIDISTLSEKEKSFLRNHKLGFIFQSFNLIPVLNVAENVEMPLIIRSDLSKNQRLEMVMSALKDVGLDTFSHHLPDQLSGGQRQRVAIARSLV